MFKLKYEQPFTILLLKNDNLMMYVMFCSHQTMFDDVSLHACVLYFNIINDLRNGSDMFKSCAGR